MTPTTRAGKALLAEWWGDDLDHPEYGVFADTLAAIEAEARAEGAKAAASKERQRIRAKMLRVGYSVGEVVAILAATEDGGGA